MSRTMKNDSRGTATFLEREARSMDPLQSYREFVQNGIEAGASKVIIDGWTDPETGQSLIRITDNGSGMTERQLIERLTTLHGQFKSAGNYGIGARIASLPFNPAGVTFASRTSSGEAMIRIHKHRGEYRTVDWQVIDEDGDTVLLDVVSPDAGMLDRLPDKATGTAVILHGDGVGDTWTSPVSYRVHRFLAERYYDFAPGVQVQVQDAASSAGHMRTVRPFGLGLAEHALADGEVPFKDIAGLSGVIFYWTLPAGQDDRRKGNSMNTVNGGVGLVVDDEIFNYDRTYSGDFGIIYKSVQYRVAVLIWIDSAEMDTARSGVILPGRGRTGIPWKKLGAYFAQHMPEEIEDLLSAVTVTSTSFDSEMAKLLDPDWMKNLAPVKVTSPDRDGEDTTGEEEAGQALPRGEDHPNPEPNPLPFPEPKPRVAANRSSNGSDPAKAKPKVVTPSVVFADPDDVPGEWGITWESSKNTILISTGFAPYMRDVGRWTEKVNHPRQVVENAVQDAYSVEYAATIIDAKGQGKHGLDSGQIDELTSDSHLYVKALGMQSLTERIAEFLKIKVQEL